MLTSAQIKERARSVLSNKLANCSLHTLIYFAISYATSFIISMISTPISVVFSIIGQEVPFLSLISSLITLVISLSTYIILIPLMFAYVYGLITICRDQSFSYGDIFTNFFKNFKRSWCIAGRTLQKIIVPIIIIVVSYFVMIVSILIISATYNYQSSEIMSVASIVIPILRIINRLYWTYSWFYILIYFTTFIFTYNIYSI